jgi:large subunit ribosomal protein L30
VSLEKKTNLQTSNRQTTLRGFFKLGEKLKVTQIRSTIGRIKKQKETIKALGIKKLYQSVVHKDTPQIRGMIEKVKHLVEVKEI